MQSLQKLYQIGSLATKNNMFRCLSTTGKPAVVQFQLYPTCLFIAAYEYIKIERKGAKSNIGLVTLNRPKALNALSDGLMTELVDALQKYDTDKDISAMILTGSEKAFAGDYRCLL